MMGGWKPLHSLRHLLGRHPEEEVEEELRYHVEERVREYVARGMDPEGARKAALERLGDLEEVRRECEGLLEAERRTEERRVRVRVSWLDVKLGLRMLAKHPGLTLVSVLGMAVAVTIAAGAFGSIHAIMDSRLPFTDGDRVVSIEARQGQVYGTPHRQILHDFLMWRDELSSVQELSAFATEARNLILQDGSTELIQVAAITASGLRVPRTSPLLGRLIVEDDERPGAEPVVLLAYEEWQRRFKGDPDVLGRPLRFGTTVHTVVGVMPEGFRFPINHRFWVPLRLNATSYERGSGPSLHVFGRLAQETTLEQAQAELTTIGRATAAAFPETHGHLQPRVLPYTAAYGIDIDTPGQALAFRVLPFGLSLLLVLVSVNVAILVYARTVTRLGEISVRSALGASRRRIVSQLFVEALVLAAVAAAAGLAVTSMALPQIEAWLRRVSPGRIPFWYDLGLSPGLMAYVTGLVILAGVIVGVVPGLKATGRHLHANLQQLSVRGGSRMRLGRLWTGMIVAQVAFAVAVLPFVLYVAEVSLEGSTAEVGYPADEFLRVGIAMERKEVPPHADAVRHQAEARARLREGTSELLRRLETEPAVSGVTFATHFPGGGTTRRVEVEEGGTYQASVTGVDTNLFRIFDVPVLAGRDFDESDGGEGASAVIVDRVFVEQVLVGGGDPVGRRIRYLTPGPDGERNEFQAGPWLEIVGVVPDFTGRLVLDPLSPRVYEPVTLAGASRLSLAVRVRGDAAAFAPELRAMAAAIDPGLQLEELRTAAAFEGFGESVMRFVALIMVAVTLSVLLLSAAGIYAMMSFTVSRRRREIGIRSALGAQPHRVLSGIFARACVQLGAGVGVGLVLAFVVAGAMGGGPLTGDGVMRLPGVAALMVAVGLLATVGPARRGLSVEPTEALSEE